ncbi:MAG: sigma-70 family RNA polymerase sigma factor [Planctomycetes bacterium]|nr:sigma-70 family RNA polymerase sigma factor [Planctomycetota bacterium]
MSSTSVPAEELLRHREWVRALARSLVRDDATADDLAQDAWLAAAETPPLRTDAPRSWFGRVLRTRAIDAFRSRSRRDAREALVARPEATPSAADTVALAESHRLVVDAVMDLDEPYRTAVLLRFFEDLPPREVARRTGVPIETARTRVRRGVERLRERLAPKDDERRRGALLALAGWPRMGGRTAAGTAAATATAGGALVAMGAKQIVALCVGALLLGAAVVAVTRPHGDDVASVLRTADPASAADAAESPRPASLPRAVRPAAGTDPAQSDPRPTSTATRTRIRIRREDGGPLVGAEFALFDAERVDARGRLAADADGVTVIEAVIDTVPADHARRLVVVPEDSAPRVVEIAAGTLESEVVLTAGATVAGRVEIEGGLPKRRLRVWLALDRPVVPYESLPQALASGVAFPPSQVAVRVAPDGTFVVRGLEAAAAGSVNLPWEFEPQTAKPGDDPGRFVAPQERIVLGGRMRLPHVEGRIVRKGTGKPLGGASVSLHGTTEGGQWTTSMNTDDDGTFALGGGDRTATDAELTVREDGGIGVFSIAVQGPFDRAIDVGDVAVPDPWASVAALRVVDVAGKAVAGAVAVFDEQTLWVSRPSGADGTVAVPLGGTARRVIVAAPGSGWLAVDAEPPTAEPQRVILPKGTLVEIRFDTAQSGVCPGMRVRVSGKSGETFDEPPNAYSLPEALGLTGAMASTRDAPGGDFSLFDVGSAMAGAGRIAIGFLRTGTPVRIEVTDAAGRTCFTTDLTLDPGERRTVEVKLPALRPWRGRVVDSADHAVAGAIVRFRDSARIAADESANEFRRMTLSGADGVFVVPGLAAPSLDVVVSARGLRPHVLRDLSLTDWASGTSERVVRLDPGRRLVVRGRDAGAWADVDAVVARPDGQESEGPFGPIWEAERTDDTEWTIDGLPAGAVEVAILRGSKERLVRTTAEQGTIEVVLDETEK